MSEDPALGDLLELLSDEYAREILAATSVKPMSANQIADRCGMSLPTVYRRVGRLKEFDLIEEQTRVEPGGNDYSEFTATLSEVSVSLDEGTFEAVVERASTEAFPGATEEDTADRFVKMWEGL
ncbi:ArsR/SmtB family transcription factor [Salinigranum salinum]|uniref:ArsR/SmtB family transcription factor n=1 Tax=Salinigranum salinum TaxID=1364937 RepID=UPI0012609183|nr:winged helix-turn-helix domain-containing protein [Salinigranum salinum]